MSIPNETKKEFKEESLIEEAFELLEWNKLKVHLASFAQTEIGKKAIRSMGIPTKIEDSQRLLNETKEITSLEQETKTELDFSRVFDIKKNILICCKEGVISSEALLQIAETISSAQRLKKVIHDNVSRPTLSALVDKIVDHLQLEKTLKNGIEKSGRISDKASKNLTQLRQELNRIQHERRKDLNKFINENNKFIQDSIVGDRYGRPVLAIKVNYIEKFKGIIHDSSASGNTIYLEPESVVVKGNKIASLKAKILKEEHTLLRAWSKMISENGETLQLNSAILLKLENALTRSRYSLFIKGNAPKFEKNANVYIKGFKHPLLIWESLQNNLELPTSIDFHINRHVKVVCITGPNTGGKTAALKGLGIAFLMARYGLFIPSTSEPILPFCPHIYADIGDDQSLEGNLSTFSGHLTRIKRILDSLNNKNGLSLVLLDEIGSGTDPVEGTALAIALLKEFANYSDLTLATTHYGEIKAIKYQDSRFENVSVTFNEKTLKPTYSLNWGIPGRSYALSISERIGINSRIIQNASEYLKPKAIDSINQIIKGLEQERKKQQHAAEAAAALIARTEILHDELEYFHENQKINAKQFQKNERAKLTQLIYEAKAEVVDLIEKLRNANASGEDARLAGIRLKEIEKQFNTDEEVKHNISWSPQIGDFIRLKSLNSTGQIIESYDEGLSFKIKLGSMQSICDLSDIEGINGEKPNLPKTKIQINGSIEDFSSTNIKTKRNTVDVRGMRVFEAEILIEEKMRKFHGPIWIIHGIGTGKLKKGLRSWLCTLNYIDKIEDALPSEGGAGCSVVWIK